MKLKFLILGLTLAVASIARAGYVPVPITPSSYNADVIVESNATPVLSVVTTASVDQGTTNASNGGNQANTWFEQGYDTNNPANGLPPANTVFTAQDNANYSFKTPPTYIGPNGILIDSVVTNGTFTLTTPTAYNLLSFLGSGGNGGDVIGVKVHHQDGTSETGSFGCPDWFGGTNIAFTAGGRCQSTVTFTTETDTANPRIYFRDVALSNTNSPVTSIDLSYVSGSSGSHNDVLGVSGATTPGGPVAPIAVTGYTYDFVVEASAAKRGRVISQKFDSINGTNVWATTQTYDNDGNTGFTFYEKGHDFNMINNGPVIAGNPAINAIAQASGIPVHGTSFTNGNHIFTMPPDYTTNDVVWLNSTTMTNATITFVTPSAASALSFLDAAGNGPVNPMVIVHHQDGSSETNSIAIPDWFSTSDTPAYIPNGRVQADAGQWSQQVITGTGADRLFQSDLILANTVSPVTSIDLIYTNTTAAGRAGVYAVSALVGTVPPIFTQQPPSTNVYEGTNVTFGVQLSSSAALTFSWQKSTNGSPFVTLGNGGNISGATTSNLTVSAAGFFTDAGNYRVIASNAGGSVTSSVALLSVFSTNADVVQPGDPATAFGISLFSDGAVGNAFDDNIGSKFAGGTSSAPCGLVVSPNLGASIVTALRFYTANDTVGGEPGDYKLEGSVNGGSTYTLIASNSLALPDGRNTGSGALDPLSQFAQEVRFSNSGAYTTYRLTFSRYKDVTQGRSQLAEIEFLGVTTNLPIQVISPPLAKAFQGTTLTIAATVTGNPTPSSHWQKLIGGVFTNLNDGGTVSGSHTATLTISPSAFSDIGQYRLIATNSLASVTGAVAQVTIFSSLPDVTGFDDTIVDFGNTSTTPAVPLAAIDDTYATFVTRGSGLNNNAGFPPFAGPVGVIVTPALGNTIISGLRVYPGSDAASSDPTDVELEGSDDGGITYKTLLPTTALSLGSDRNPANATVDPISATNVQEILFANNLAYTSYRVTFNHTKDDNNVSFMSVGEIELLGFASSARPEFASTVLSGGKLNFTGSGGTAGGTFSVLTNSSLTVPLSSWGVATNGVFDVNGDFSLSLPVSGSIPHLYYVIKTP